MSKKRQDVQEGNAPVAFPERRKLELNELPSTEISGRVEVDEAITHFVDAITDFHGMDGNAQTNDPLLWLNVRRALASAEDALKAAIDAQCAHAVARALLLDREQVACGKEAEHGC